MALCMPTCAFWGFAVLSAYSSSSTPMLKTSTQEEKWLLVLHHW
jgi:hypothetical protein